MTFDIDAFRKSREAVQRTEIVLELPPGPLEYRIEGRSSYSTMAPFITKRRQEVAEHLVELTSRLKEVADEKGGHQSVLVHAKPTAGGTEESIAFYKYSPAQESWIQLYGLDLLFEVLEPKVISEKLRFFEQIFMEGEAPNANTRSDVDPIDDPEVDDDPTPTGKRKRDAWREHVRDVIEKANADSEEEPEEDPPKKKKPAFQKKKKADPEASGDDDEDDEPEEEPASDDDEPDDKGPAPDDDPTDDGAATKSPPSSAGAKTMGPPARDSGMAPPPKGKELKMPKRKGVMGMDPDKDGFAKHGQRQTLPMTVMGASKQLQAWRGKYIT